MPDTQDVDDEAGAAQRSAVSDDGGRQASDARGPDLPRRRWLRSSAGLAVLGICSLAGLAVGSIIPGPASARAEVVYDTSGLDGGTEQRIATQEEVLGSRAVVEPVAITNGLTADQLYDLVIIDRLAPSSVFQVTVTTRDPALSSKLADELAQQYVTYISSPPENRQLTLLQSRLAKAQAELEEAPAATRGEASDVVDDLRAQVVRVEAGRVEDANRAQLVTASYPVPDSYGGNSMRGLAVGVAVSVVVVVLAVALGAVRRRHRVVVLP